MAEYDKNNENGVQKAKNPGLGSGGGGQHLSLDLSSYIHLIDIIVSMFVTQAVYVFDR